MHWYWGISMSNVDNIQHDNVVLNSACARLGIDADAEDAKFEGGQRTPRPLKQCAYTAKKVSKVSMVIRCTVAHLL